MGIDLYSCSDCGNAFNMYQGGTLYGCYCERWVCFNCCDESDSDRKDDDDDDDTKIDKNDRKCYLCIKDDEENNERKKCIKDLKKIIGIISDSRIRKNDKNYIISFLQNKFNKF